jgi:hypothetical protein
MTDLISPEVLKPHKRISTAQGVDTNTVHKLKQIADNPMYVRGGNGGSLDMFDIILPYQCTIDGAFYKFDQQTWASVGNLDVPVQLRGQGIGERLVRGFFALCAQTDTVAVESSIINPVALRIRERIFGEGLLHIYHEHIEDNEQNEDDEQITPCLELPITIKQASDSIDRATVMAELLEDIGVEVEFSVGMRVKVIMQEIDTNGWERPQAAPSKLPEIYTAH